MINLLKFGVIKMEKWKCGIIKTTFGLKQT
jgi:hypothetical protein